MCDPIDLPSLLLTYPTFTLTLYSRHPFSPFPLDPTPYPTLPYPILYYPILSYSECGATFISIKAGTLMDKWFGEADKLVGALFRSDIDRQTDRQTDTQTHRQTVRQISAHSRSYQDCNSLSHTRTHTPFIPYLIQLLLPFTVSYPKTPAPIPTLPPLPLSRHFCPHPNTSVPIPILPPLSLARKLAPTVIFIDEIDTLLKKRGAGDSSGSACTSMQVCL